MFTNDCWHYVHTKYTNPVEISDHLLILENILNIYIF